MYDLIWFGLVWPGFGLVCRSGIKAELHKRQAELAVEVGVGISKPNDDHYRLPQAAGTMGASQCGNDRPGFGVHSVTQKLRAYNVIRVETL